MKHSLRKISCLFLYYMQDLDHLSSARFIHIIFCLFRKLYLIYTCLSYRKWTARINMRIVHFLKALFSICYTMHAMQRCIHQSET